MKRSRPPGQEPLGRALPRLSLVLVPVASLWSAAAWAQGSLAQDPFEIGVCEDPPTLAIRRAEPDLQVRRDRPDIVPPCELPRPGYEPRNIRLGQTILAPEATAAAVYNSNVFAASNNEDDDLIGVVAPRLRAATTAGKLRLDSELYASVFEYAENESEERVEYGGLLSGAYEINRANLVRARIRYAHDAEPRTDPDADRNPGEPIPERERFDADLQYRYRQNRLTVTPRLTAERVDYVNSNENQKDRWEMGASARGSLLVSGNVEAFLQPYARFNDYDLRANQLDRDFATFGFLTGASFGGGKWLAELGVGAFYADFDDPAFDDFVGFGARGALAWSITERTLLRGLVARDVTPTTRAGSPARIDTRLAASVEQEIRRNLLATAGIELRATEYRQVSRDLLSASLSLGAEYLLNRSVSLVFGIEYTQRFAEQDFDEFDRFVALAGTRLRF